MSRQKNMKNIISDALYGDEGYGDYSDEDEQ
jgi:hypothetical protein